MKLKTYIALSLALSSALTLSANAKENDVVARGSIVAISSTSVTVQALTCAITPATKYEDRNGASTTIDQFQVGDFAKLKCRGDSATELELEDEQSGGGNNGGGNNGGGNGFERSRSTRLSAVEGVSTQASGRVEYEVKKEGKKRREFRFRTWVKVPVPSTVPAAADNAQASALTLSLTLSRDGAAYAVCDLVFNHLHKNPNSFRPPYAEYRIDIRNKKGGIVSKKGVCDTDLAADGIQAGIPAPKAGDVLVVQDELAGAFLDGTM